MNVSVLKKHKNLVMTINADLALMEALTITKKERVTAIQGVLDQVIDAKSYQEIYYRNHWTVQ